VLAEVVDGNVLLIDATSAELITLNGVGSVVWASLADGEATVDQSVAAVLEDFPDAPQESVAADVAAFLDDLAGAGMVLIGP